MSGKSSKDTEECSPGRNPIRQKLSKLFGFKSQEFSNEEKFGLFEFQSESTKCFVDVIAVHGLGGHYEKTWTSVPVAPTSETPETPCIWLKDLIPSEIPDARILSFGYNSAVALSKSIGDVEMFASQLLSLTLRERGSENQKRRPIIFVSHSLGGIVVKKVRLTGYFNGLPD